MRLFHNSFPDADPLLKNIIKAAGRILPEYANYIEIRAKVEIFRDSYSVCGADITRIDQKYPDNDLPLVSIIVPNYNHEPYLEQRLESIYSQTYQKYEVILLDDCSTDNSRDILSRYCNEHPECTRTFFNDSNSGHVFTQWERGLSLAKGELIWIAESDDWCDSDFLEKLVPSFERQSVMIAFSRSTFMKNGERESDLETYLEKTDIETASPFIISAADAVKRGFAYRNIIPNVSSAIFRNIRTIPEEILTKIKSLKLCGDWLFYLTIAKGGCIAYTPQTTNYYRLHDASTSVKIQSTQRYFEEVMSIARYLAENYRLREDTFETIADRLKIHYEEHAIGTDSAEVEHWFNISELKQIQKTRKPNVLMCGFSMVSGGGEVFPIHLANALRKKGVAVTFVDFDMDRYVPEVRTMLSPTVPLIHLSSPALIPDLIQTMDADVIHSHHGSVDRLISLLSARNSCKHVVTLHGMYETMSPSELENFLPNITRSCKKFFYISDKNLIPFREHSCFDSSAFVKVDNGLEKKSLIPVTRQELDIPPDAFVLCIVSRARLDKGWIEASEAVIQANKVSEKPIHLILVGSGEAYDKVISLKSPYLHAVGFQKDPMRYYYAADAGLLPSYFSGESFPLVIIECLFAGKPVIASNVGEIPNMLTTEDSRMAGIVFDMHRGETDSLKRIILELSNDPSRIETMSEAIPALTERLDINNVAEKYLCEYRALTQNMENS